jgi:hypothetical protein
MDKANPCIPGFFDIGGAFGMEVAPDSKKYMIAYIGYLCYTPISAVVRYEAASVSLDITSPQAQLRRAPSSSQVCPPHYIPMRSPGCYLTPVIAIISFFPRAAAMMSVGNTARVRALTLLDSLSKLRILKLSKLAVITSPLSHARPRTGFLASADTRQALT